MADLRYGSSTLSRVAYSNASSVLSEANSVYLGSTLLWTKASSASWITRPNGTVFLAAYTPATNVSIASIEMIHAGNTNYNYSYGIWLRTSSTSATPVTGAVGQNTTGVTITAGSTYLSKQQYIHKKTYTSGSYPALTAGNTYLIGLGDRYQDTFTLSGTLASYTGQDWQAGQSPITVATSANLLYLKVTTA